MIKVNPNDIITAIGRQDSATSRYLATQEDKLQVFGKEYTLPVSNAWANFGDLIDFNLPVLPAIRQVRTRVRRRKEERGSG